MHPQTALIFMTDRCHPLPPPVQTCRRYTSDTFILLIGAIEVISVSPPRLNVENLPILCQLLRTTETETNTTTKMTYNVKIKLRAEACSKANTRIYIYAIFIDVRERSFTHHRNYMHATYHYCICDGNMLAAAYINVMRNRM
jgi:hypothetical protein